MNNFSFEKTNERIIGLNDERYLRIKTYRTGEGDLSVLSDRQVLKVLLQQPFYDHLLVGPIGYDRRDSDIQGSGQHGPFALKYLSPKLYRRLTVQEFSTRLKNHYEDPFYLNEGADPVPDSTIEEINRFLEALPLRSCRIFSLELHPSENKNDQSYFGDMPLHSDFNEYILVDQCQLHFFIIAWE